MSSKFLLPPAAVPIGARGEVISQAWYRALRELAVRVGGDNASTIRELEEAIEELRSEIDGLGSWTELEVDFGSEPVYSASFTITDPDITAAKPVRVMPLAKAASGRTADDWAFDGASFAATPGAGQAVVYASFIPGPVVGRRVVQYSVG